MYFQFYTNVKLLRASAVKYKTRSDFQMLPTPHVYLKMTNIPRATPLIYKLTSVTFKQNKSSVHVLKGSISTGGHQLQYTGLNATSNYLKLMALNATSSYLKCTALNATVIIGSAWQK